MNKQVTIYFTKRGNKAHKTRHCRHIKKRVVSEIKISGDTEIIPCYTCFKIKEKK